MNEKKIALVALVKKLIRSIFLKLSSVLLDELMSRMYEFIGAVESEWAEEKLRSAAVKQVVSDELVTVLQRNYPLMDSSIGGLYGGLITLDDLRLGDVVEISIYIYMPGVKESLRFRHVTGLEGPLDEPVVEIDEFWAPAGATIVLTQVGGNPRKHHYSLYRR